MAREKMESFKDLMEEKRYARFLQDNPAVSVSIIEKLNPSQYGIDWCGYNEKGHAIWFAEFKRRYKDYDQLVNVVGVSAYKVAHLSMYAGIATPTVIFGFNDCVGFVPVSKVKPAGCRHGGNPKPKDKWEREPMVYYRKSDIKIVNGPIPELFIENEQANLTNEEWLSDYAKA